MQISLAGKVAIVTGVSGDGQVGQAVAKALAENGAQLAICARKQSNVEARTKELRDAGARVFSMVGSLTDEGQVGRRLQGVREGPEAEERRLLRFLLLRLGALSAKASRAHRTGRPIGQ